MIYENICKFTKKCDISINKLEEKANVSTGSICKWGRSVRIRVYYKWETENVESLHAKEIKFCGSTFSYNKIDLPSLKYIKTIPGDKVYSWESGERVKVRFVYYGVKTKYNGTIFADLRDGTIPNKTHFYKDSSIDDIVKMFETNATVAMVIFYIVSGKTR